MLKVKCMINEEGYIMSYTDVAFEVEGEYDLVEVESSWVAKREVIVDNVVEETTYMLNSKFSENFMYFKVVDGKAIFDEDRKKQTEKQFIQRALHDVRLDILKNEETKKVYEERGWDTTEIVKTLAELSTKESELVEMLSQYN